jgi:phosphopantetheine--protein transferase-like protein
MIKCGIDSIELERLKHLNPAIRERFLIRVFTPTELNQARDRNDFLTSLFAAKEAVSKALGTGIGFVAWKDIEIIHLPSGEPTITLHGNALIIAEEKGLVDWSVSITHDRTKAVAIAIGSSG